MILFLFACVGNPELSPYEQGCTNVDFSDPQPSEIKSTTKGTKADVWRTMVDRDNIGDLFDLEISGEGNIIEVHEAWTSGTDGTATCLEPHVVVKDFHAEVEVRWFTDGGSVPFDTITLTPE